MSVSIKTVIFLNCIFSLEYLQCTEKHKKGLYPWTLCIKISLPVHELKMDGDENPGFRFYTLSYLTMPSKNCYSKFLPLDKERNIDAYLFLRYKKPHIKIQRPNPYYVSHRYWSKILLSVASWFMECYFLASCTSAVTLSIITIPLGSRLTSIFHF